VAAADRERFGGCTLHGECQAACPKKIDLGVIARMNRDYLTAALATWWRGS
jgi:succinate dehydrogenase / fumarate reductase iron-sulfur subunit